MSLLKPFASKRFTLASPPGEVSPLIKFSLSCWRKCCFLKMDYNLLFNISLCFSCLSYYPMEELLRTSHSLSVLAFSRAATAGIDGTAAALLGHCKGKKVLLLCEIHIPIFQKTHVLAPPSSIRPEDWVCCQVRASLLAVGQTAALPGLWSSRCYGGVEHPVRKKCFRWSGKLRWCISLSGD